MKKIFPLIFLLLLTLKIFAQELKEKDLYYEYNDIKKALFEKYINDNAPSENAFIALQRLASKHIRKKEFTKAVSVFKKFKSKFPNDKRIGKIIAMLNKPSRKVILKSISSEVNTDGDEFAPVITTDNKYLYFAGKNRTDNYGRTEDIFVSKKVNGKWTKANKVKELNTQDNNEAPGSLSADGNTMLFFFNGDIYFSEKTKTGWSKKKKFPVINTIYWEGNSYMTADGKAILFASDRPGCVGEYHRTNTKFHGDYAGNTDIYVSVKNDSSWSKPLNLGIKINTPYSERSPFLHPDMKTLYFSSGGYENLGRLDVFKCTRLNDTLWTEWSTPVNLGKEFNTPGYDYNYKITTDGKTAYFVYDKANSDIYSVKLPKELRPNYVATISGVVTDNSNNFLQADIVWEELKTGRKIGTLKSNPQTGEYYITLPLGKKYGFYVQKKGYYPVSGNIDLRKKKKAVSITRNFKLTTIKQIVDDNISIPLENLFFEFNKYKLSEESYPELNRFMKFLKQNKNLKIEISGHTDNIGNKNYNKQLSQKRADAVKTYLVNNGINTKQLSAKGYGMSKPISSNKSKEGRAKNRRVEFRVLR